MYVIKTYGHINMKQNNFAILKNVSYTYTDKTETICTCEVFIWDAMTWRLKIIIDDIKTGKLQMTVKPFYTIFSNFGPYIEG